MPTKQEIRTQVQILSKTIIDKLREFDPQTPNIEEEILGIAIFIFPEDHAKNGYMNITAMGKVCTHHMIEAIITELSGQKGELNPLAT
jgi:hypothetical protein